MPNVSLFARMKRRLVMIYVYLEAGSDVTLRAKCQQN